MPRRGDLALCSRGELGMIICDVPVPVKYQNGNHASAYIGVHLAGGKEGSPWSSRDPKIVGHISDLLDSASKWDAWDANCRGMFDGFNFDGVLSNRMPAGGGPNQANTPRDEGSPFIPDWKPSMAGFDGSGFYDGHKQEPKLYDPDDLLVGLKVDTVVGEEIKPPKVIKKSGPSPYRTGYDYDDDNMFHGKNLDNPCTP